MVFSLLVGRMSIPSCTGRPWSPSAASCALPGTLWRKMLLRQALEDGTSPSWASAGGIQFLNAALGGTLYQDLPTEHPSEIGHSMKPPYDRMAHTVHIWPMTPLASLLGKTELEVNSCHHQAIRSLAPSLVEMARSTDDLIEAMYLPGKTFVWGVQWHPGDVPAGRVQQENF